MPNSTATPRVLFVSHTGEWGGGAEVVLLQLLAAAREAGVTPCLVCPAGELADRAMTLAPVQCLSLPRFRRTHNPVLLASLVVQWIVAVCRLTVIVGHADVVHANSGVATLTACVPALLLRRSLVWHQHDIVPWRTVNTLVLGTCGRLATIVVGCSHAVNESLERLGVPRDRLRIEYNCARSEFAQAAMSGRDLRLALGIPADTMLVGMVGRLVPRKGQDIFLQALRILAERGGKVHGLIAGAASADLGRDEAGYLDSLRTLASHPAVEARVNFLGYVEDIPALLGACDAIVMPSVNDPFPLAVIEALAVGVPVIASDSGGHPEAIVDGVTGLLVAPRDAEALADAIERLSRDVELRTKLARAGRAMAVERFSEAALPGRLHALYGEAIEQRRTPHPLAPSPSRGEGRSGHERDRQRPALRGQKRSSSPQPLTPDPSPLGREGSGVRGPRAKLSVLIPCFNNQDIIETCLESVHWADEIVVCDSFSTDGTLEVAGRYADRILQRVYRNSASQKNWALPQLRHDWVLIVDTDERVTPELRAEIEEVLSDPGPTAGYRIPRANYLFGRWLRHGDAWPDYQIRLFRRDLGRYFDREVHAHVVLDEPVETLSQPLQHHPHRSMAELRRVILQRYTTWEAMEKHKRGVRFRRRQLVLRPAGCFVHRYLLRGGFRDGWQGLLMATVWAYYVFISYLKLRAIERSLA